MNVTLTLPYPPSANALWRAVNGRNIASRAYRHWCKAADAEIMAQRVGVTFSGPYGIQIIAERPDKRRRDLGNLEKAISDALVRMRVVADDCNAAPIHLDWSDAAPTRTARVHVTLWHRSDLAQSAQPSRAKLPTSQEGSSQ